jgi:DNA polymerase I-like protein with 3'-5' exonuclease and polymerase domains
MIQSSDSISAPAVFISVLGQDLVEDLTNQFIQINGEEFIINSVSGLFTVFFEQKKNTLPQVDPNVRQATSTSRIVLVSPFLTILMIFLAMSGYDKRLKSTLLG